MSTHNHTSTQHESNGSVPVASDNPKPTERDLWLLSRLMVGQPVDDYRHHASASWRPLIDEMSRARLGDAAAIFEKYQVSIEDHERDSLIRDVSRQDPSGPLPDAEPNQEWESPQLTKQVSVDPFPVDVFPAGLQRLINDAAHSFNCPCDHLGAAALVVAGGAIGRSTSLLMKDGYFASASYYMALVAEAGVTKSAALSAMSKPLWDIEVEMHELHEQAMTDYEKASKDFTERMRQAQRCKQTEVRARGKAGRSGGKSGGEDEIDDDTCEDLTTEVTPIPPARPTERRVVADDITMEALAEVQNENERGLVLLKDELSSLIGQLDQYKSGGKGDGRAKLLSMWSGAAYSVDRKGSKDGRQGGRSRVLVPHSYLSMVGCMVPDNVDLLHDKRHRADGFIDRFLFAWPDWAPKQDWVEEGIDGDVAQVWADIVRRLHALPMGHGSDGRPHPNTVRFNSDAKARFVYWVNAHRAEMREDDFPCWLRGQWQKLEEYVGRLILTLHLLSWAADPTHAVSHLDPVNLKTVEDAIRLIEYFKKCANRALAELRAKSKGTDGSDFARAILKHIKRNALTEFSERDLTHAMPRLKEDPKALAEALLWLQNRKCIRKQPAEPKQARRSGRPHTPVYDVNPDLVRTLGG